jgi:hypothetical protein
MTSSSAPSLGARISIMTVCVEHVLDVSAEVVPALRVDDRGRAQDGIAAHGLEDVCIEADDRGHVALDHPMLQEAQVRCGDADERLAPRRQQPASLAQSTANASSNNSAASHRSISAMQRS